MLTALHLCFFSLFFFFFFFFFFFSPLKLFFCLLSPVVFLGLGVCSAPTQQCQQPLLSGIRGCDDMAKQQQQLETCRVEVRGVVRSVPLASVEDMETALIREVGPGRLLAHGTALKPSSTTSTAASSTSSTAPSAADGAAPGTDSATGGAPATGPAAAPVAPAAPAAASAVYVFREAIDGAFMGRPFPVWTMLKTLPLAGAVTALGTLAVCYSVAHAGRHLPFQLPLPYVSLLGYRSPERWLYLGGFASVAAVFLAAAVPLYVAMSWFVERSNRLLWRTVGFWVAVAVMGMVGQVRLVVQWCVFCCEGVHRHACATRITGPPPSLLRVHTRPLFPSSTTCTSCSKGQATVSAVVSPPLHRTCTTCHIYASVCLSFGAAVDAKLTLQSKVHQGCAALFFFGTVASCVALLQLA